KAEAAALFAAKQKAEIYSFKSSNRETQFEQKKPGELGFAPGVLRLVAGGKLLQNLCSSEPVALTSVMASAIKLMASVYKRSSVEIGLCKRPVKPLPGAAYGLRSENQVNGGNSL